MSSTTYFYLFKVTVDPKENSEYSSLKEMLENPPSNPIAMAKKGNKFLLDGPVRRIGGLFTGTFCLIQTNELPTKAKFGEEPSDIIGEEEDGGLGHYTSFIYDSSNDVIGVQSNRNGVSANGIASYFRRNFNVRDISLEVIINPDEIEKLQKMTSISSFAVTIAKPQSGVAFNNRNQPRAIKEMTDVADRTAANTMTLQLSIGYDRNGTLRKGAVSSYVRSLFSREDSLEIRKVEIRGRETDEDNLETIDLVTNKVSIPVAYKTPRSITPRFLRDILRKAVDSYTELKPKIDRTYKVKRSRN